MSNKSLENCLSFGFEQTFTIEQWWTEPGFTATSDTPLKREKMLDLAKSLAVELEGKYFESKDIWDHMQYEVTDQSGETQFYVTMDPGSIEVKTPPCLCKDAEKMATPLFAAAEKAGVVPYRTWWYGVKGGTEGGCHVNMGGFTEQTNPLITEPDLVVKYAAYIHNRPFLHFPFMGIDVGPEGNAMRMDEKPGFDEVKNKLAEYPVGKMKPEEVHPYFEQTNLISEKASFPSLYKFKTGLFLIEDRAQEALRAPEDFYLVSLLRLRILEQLQLEDSVENLKTFPKLHKEELTSFYLWDQFSTWAENMHLPVEKFLRFFERQFPRLSAGQNIPTKIFINDGRRPRVIKDIQKRGDVVVSKTIDTNYKRFEIYTSEPKAKIEVKTEGVELFSEALSACDGTTYHYVDLRYNSEKPALIIKLSVDGDTIEEGNFNIHNMMWD